MFTDIVILAGGSGERLWPASTERKPKQFMAIESGVSFLHSTLLRALALEVTGAIMIITREDLLDEMTAHCQSFMDQLDDINRERLHKSLFVVAEPVARNTAAPAILACRLLELLYPNCEHTILMLTSDHIIYPASKFAADTYKAYTAATGGWIVCYGITPTEPATGYGYIKTAGPADNLPPDTAYLIERFREKPDLATAKEYLESGEYWWNSGMYAFTAPLLIEEMEQCEPAVSQAFRMMEHGSKPKTETQDGIQIITRWDAMIQAYQICPSISIDKAVAEKTGKACAVPASFDWDDVGSWDAFEHLFRSDVAKTTEVQSQNCFVHSDIPVALCGVSDLIVVIKNGNALVLKKGKSELVKEAVQLMKGIDK